MTSREARSDSALQSTRLQVDPAQWLLATVASR